jgi:hypothetical protein
MNSDYSLNKILNILHEYTYDIKTEFDESGIPHIYIYPIIPVKYIKLNFTVVPYNSGKQI